MPTNCENSSIKSKIVTQCISIITLQVLAHFVKSDQ